MAFDMLKIIVLSLKFLLPYSIQVILERVDSLVHRYTYKAVDSPKNVVIIGGSFAGIELARRFSHSLPSGYRVLVVERNSHFNYTFNFPRFSVLQGRESLAFIPYGGLAKLAPEGIFEHVHGEVINISKNSVKLASGEEIPFAYLVLATGSAQSPPAKLSATEKGDACLELQKFQSAIKTAPKIAVVGGGAVGVELATDIISYFPEKLHEYVLAALKKLGVKVVLGERPQLVPSKANDEKSSYGLSTVQFPDGRVEKFDLVIPCVGQKANSTLISTLIPEAVSDSTGHINVKPTMQISGDSATDNIFAIGDVAGGGGPKMARAAFFQAAIVGENVLSLIRGQHPKAQYLPNPAIEGALKLTLGKSDWVV